MYIASDYTPGMGKKGINSDPHEIDHSLHLPDWISLIFRNPFAIVVSVIVILTFLSGVIAKLDMLFDDRINTLIEKNHALEVQVEILKTKIEIQEGYLTK